MACFSCSCIYFRMVAPLKLDSTNIISFLPKNVDFRMYISSLHVYRTSLMHFYPWDTLLKLDTLNFAGIKSICTWSGIIYPSSISTPLYLHSVLMIACSPVLSIDCFSMIFYNNTIVILAHPSCMCQTIIFICHKTSPFFFTISLNNFIVVKRWGFWYNLYYPPAVRVAFCCTFSHAVI